MIKSKNQVIYFNPWKKWQLLFSRVCIFGWGNKRVKWKKQLLLHMPFIQIPLLALSFTIAITKENLDFFFISIIVQISFSCCFWSGLSLPVYCFCIIWFRPQELWACLNCWWYDIQFFRKRKEGREVDIKRFNNKQL